MDKIFFENVKMEIIGKEKKPKRKNILVSATLKDTEGNEYTWYPRYYDLNKICQKLIALHGRRELIRTLLGDMDKMSLEELREEFF